MASEIVIAIYRPHAGRAAALHDLVREHPRILRAAGLITAREPVVMCSAEDGTVLEVFEWRDAHAASKAHEDAGVAAHWAAMEQAADFLSPGELAEAGRRFPHFRPLE